MNLRDAIRNVYRQVDAPAWAAPNLDALLDVLRDLSWLPEGPVEVTPPRVDGPDAARLTAVLRRAGEETSAGARPVVLARHTC